MDEKDLEKIEDNISEEVENVEIENEENVAEEAEEIEEKPKKKTGKLGKIVDILISLIILVACTAGLIYSGTKLFGWLKNNQKSNALINEINDIAGVGGIDEDAAPGAEFGLDFEALTAYNSDIVGWIRIPGTAVNYSVARAEDNSKYLRHSIDLTYNEFGWIFMDYKNAPDFTDKNTVIYGHNIVSGLMFADLTNIYNGSMGTDVEIDIYRSDYRLLKYKVFSTYVYEPETYYLTTRFANDEQYSNYLNAMVGRSVWNFNQNVGIDDKIITLSTCTTDSKNRIVVHAKLVSDTEMPR